MVGIERTTVPLIAEEDFGIVSRVAILSFLVKFGAAKAVSKSRRRRARGALPSEASPHCGLADWPRDAPLVIGAPSWGWVIATNALLGINQGLCWSMTVTMKIDLAGMA